VVLRVLCGDKLPSIHSTQRTRRSIEFGERKIKLTPLKLYFIIPSNTGKEVIENI
jgi:hypothetical protein